VCVDSGSSQRPPKEKIEYNALQSFTSEKKIELIQKDHRYFALLENPSIVENVVYCEELTKYIKLHSKMYDSGMKSMGALVDEYIKDESSKKEIMLDLEVCRNNAIHFIKDEK